MFWYDGNCPAAEHSFKKALQLKPSSAPARQWYSHDLRTVDGLDESIAEIKSVLELDPRSSRLRTMPALLLYFERRYDLVIEESREALERESSGVIADFNLGRAYSQMKMHRAAIT